MNNSKYYNYAWFSNLAYVNWSESNTANRRKMVEAASQAQKVPEKLGEKIFLENKENFSVLSYHPNDESGFKASLYGNGKEKILAICGTEPYVPDLTQADIADIGIFGLAIHQAVGLFNYVMRLRAAPGESNVLQLRFMEVNDLLGVPVPPGVNYLVRSDPTDGVSDYYWFEASYTGKAEADTNPAAQLSASDTLTLTGHSLGGHLANFALRLFPNLFDQSVTFNAAGFDPVTAGPAALRWTDEFVDLFADFLPSPPASSFAAVADRLYVLESESSGPGNDLSFVASNACGFSPKDEIFITTEKNSHSMDQFMDALAVQALLTKMNPSWSHVQTGELICAASSTEGASEEGIVNALSTLFLSGDDALPLEKSEASSDRFSPAPFDARDALHSRLIKLENVIDGFGNIQIDFFKSTSPSVLNAAALRQDNVGLAARYALVHLNPFIITGNDALYAQHNTNGELDLVNPSTGQGLSEQYLKARAKFLALKNELAVADRPWQATIPSDMHGYYEDRGSQFAINNTYNATRVPAVEYIFGSDGPDVIESFRDPRVPHISFNDHLFGGAGNDIIRGHAGDDYLEGGPGQDSMDGGKDNDTFYIQGTDTDYDIFRGGPGTDTILGSNGDDTIRVHKFTGEDTVEVIDGGEGFDVIAGTDGADIIDLTGTSLISIERIEGGKGNDTILGSMGNDTIHGGEDDDVITGNKGDDLLVGGSGRDVYVYAEGDGHDTIIDSGDNLIQLRLADGSIVPVGDFLQQDASTWESVDGLMRLVHNTTWKILMPGGGSIDLGAGFTEGDYGIRLITPSSMSLTLTGTANRDEMGISTPGSNPVGWELYFASFPPNASSTSNFLYMQQLPFTAPRMHITGGASGDFLFGFQSRDEIFSFDPRFPGQSAR